MPDGTHDIDLDAPAMSNREALVRAHVLIDLIDDMGELSMPDAADRDKLKRAKRLVGQVIGNPS